MKEKSYQKFFRTYIVVILVLAGFLSGLYIGRSKFVENNILKQGNAEIKVLNKYTDKANEIDFNLFWEVWDLVLEKFILGNVKPDKLLHGAIKGMVASLDDPYSVYMDPEETKKFQEEIDGSFEGIGAEIGIREKRLTIVSVLKGTPAEKANLRSKDVILKIDEKETIDLGLFEAVSIIRGPKGTSVRLTIYREGSEEPIIQDVIRDKIEVSSVKSEMKKDPEGNDVLYLNITTFSEDTSNEFKKAISENLKNNPKGVILDLRNNSGGLLSEAVSVSSEFFEKNSIVAFEAFNDGRKKEFRTETDPRISDLPLIVLVNEGTASASEILAGALRDNRGIRLVGEKTYGKGTVQELINLEGDSSLRISVAKWLTPKETDINKEGLSVDVEVKLTEEDYEKELDPQLEKGLELLF